MAQDWYRYTARWGDREQVIIRPMTASQAGELGAELVPDFDPDKRVASVLEALLHRPLVVSFPPEGELERGYSVAAEVPR